ncbi:MAG: hypothetical protein SFU99_21130 [Saprospiraceae bacterium]|nr:hypothetical protein [Saprospiraceae bacterium]
MQSPKKLEQARRQRTLFFNGETDQREQGEIEKVCEYLKFYAGEIEDKSLLYAGAGLQPVS